MESMDTLRKQLATGTTRHWETPETLRLLAERYPTLDVGPWHLKAGAIGRAKI